MTAIFSASYRRAFEAESAKEKSVSSLREQDLGQQVIPQAWVSVLERDHTPEASNEKNYIAEQTELSGTSVCQMFWHFPEAIYNVINVRYIASFSLLLWHSRCFPFLVLPGLLPSY